MESRCARVAARLLNIYNECVDWREMEAEKDLRGFLVTATLAMLSETGITSRCYPNACIHGEREMQTRPVTPIHCAT